MDFIKVQPEGRADMDRSQDELSELATSPIEQEPRRADEVVAVYLSERVAEFREVSDLQKKGWSSKEADKFFEKQRQVADNCDAPTARLFYDMMQRMALYLNQATGGLTVANPAGSTDVSIMDFCMAPGGFLGTALSLNPGSRALAFTLPSESGGHEILLPYTPNVTTKFLDITMLAADMGVMDIPIAHPDAANFLPQVFKPGPTFDLVLCDGQVLRTQARASYRENREARRLTTTQLALGLEHVKPDGTMIVLLHKVEAWETVRLLHRFSKFSTVQLFKPTTSHAKRSSFYMVAAGIQHQHPEAVLAVECWKTSWKVVTFGTDEECEGAVREGELAVDEVLEEFGPELVRMGRAVWEVQAKALARAPWMRS
ncbi:hypothetical protein LTR36_001557 [Oleoguttula mirabilis]|uniref:Ribosomal RNA methyltransferase FtsJ domain-containing protein n=1 Tax=Oleoguttula mirabilis TaxID=1507867 RepID=A0AAV9JMP4_9PEZI|nr:hypothetical protein LTR36_001557 [Oleoguttula mirabilis]